jgi:histidinol-phosphate aminotransferase
LIRLTKAFGLAGVRLGISISSAGLSEIFNKTKAPYNISTPASQLANAALSDEGIAVMRRNVGQILEQREYLLHELSKIPFFGKVLGDNNANFILLQVLNKGNPSNALALKIYTILAEAEGIEHTKLGIVVRYRGMEHHCQGCLRITVGTLAENQELLSKLRGTVVMDIVNAELV